jgi:hypothetical protein
MDTNEHELKCLTADRCSVVNPPFKFSIRVYSCPFAVDFTFVVFVIFTYCES